MDVSESPRHFLMGAGHTGCGIGRVVVIGHDKIENLPAAERVMNDVTFRATPQNSRIPAQFLRHILGRNDRPVGRMAGDARFAVAQHLLAYIRAQSVSPDESAPRYPFTGCQGGGNARPLLFVSCDRA